MTWRVLAGTALAALLVVSSTQAAELLQLQMLESDAGPAPPLQPDADRIKLRTVTIDVDGPSGAQALAAGQEAVTLAAQALGQPPPYLYYLVHVPRRAGYWDADAINAAGFAAVQIIHENTIVVRCPTDRLQDLRNVAGADYIVAYHPQWKVAPELAAGAPGAAGPDSDGAGRLTQAVVCLFPGEPLEPNLSIIAAAGGGILNVVPNRGDGAWIRCSLREPALGVAADLPGVNWIEPDPRPRTTNDYLTGETAIAGDSSRGLINAYEATHHATRPVTGSGQLVGHIDSGVDRGEYTTLWHVDLDGAGKVTGSGLQNRATGIFFADIGYTGWYASSAAGARNIRFQSTFTGEVATIILYLAHGHPTKALGGTMVCRIRQDGSPPGSVVTDGTSNTVDASGLAYAFQEITFTYTSGSRPSLTRNTYYYLELDFESVTGINVGNTLDRGYDGYETTTGYDRSGATWTGPYTTQVWYTRIDDETGDDHWLDLTGHGTHTGGTILAAGDGTPKYRGVAYAASLRHRCAGVGASPWISIPDYYAAWEDMHANDAARVHSNSWGGGTPGAYDTSAREADRFMWDHPTSLVLCAAGNSGADSATPTGIIDPTSVDAPGTAKSILSVGASETYRTAYSFTYSPSYWPNAPISGSQRTQQSDTNGGDTTVYGEGLMAFSSRGPTNDTAGPSGERRIKPDVVAPGWLFSTRSYYDDAGGYDNDGTHPGSSYTAYNGTSMSCPAVAGAAALVRDYLVDYEGVAEPTAALVKAVLIAGCDNLSPGQYQTGAYRELYDNASATGSPDFSQGYGRVDVARSLGMLDALDRGWYQSGNGFTDTTSARYVTVRAASSTPLSGVLVWTDYPAAAGATDTIINDLDLEIRTEYTGAKDSGTLVAQPLLPYNEQDGSGGGTGDDDRNTVEKCAIASPTPNTYYTFEVDAETLGNIGGDDQDFALFITGDYDSPTPVTVLDFTGRDSAAGPRLRWRLADGPDLVGCHVLRSLSPDGPFERVSGRMITPEAGEYHFTDLDLDLPRGKAYYRIVGIGSDGTAEEQDSPPFAVSAD